VKIRFAVQHGKTRVTAASYVNVDTATCQRELFSSAHNQDTYGGEFTI